MKIAGAEALVTGANRGLGKALVQGLRDAGAAKIYAGARNAQAISKVCIAALGRIDSGLLEDRAKALVDRAMRLVDHDKVEAAEFSRQ